MASARLHGAGALFAASVLVVLTAARSAESAGDGHQA